jgi:hypothetical protein
MNQLGLLEIVGIVVVLALIAWPMVFFQVVRPRIMARIGRWLEVGVHESLDPLDAGLFDTEQGAPLRKTVALAVADFVVIVVGVAGVLSAVAIPLFLLVESGLPSRWEGQLTGTSVRIGDIVVPPMTDRKTTARVSVRDEAREAMRSCQLDLAGYTARNGYLAGTSNYFDLAPDTGATIDLVLSVMQRVPGTHRFQINLECGLRLKDSAHATLEIRD